jgi:hypothetical protein
MHLQKVRWENMDWIDVAQNRDRWRARVNAVRNLHKMEVSVFVHGQS